MTLQSSPGRRLIALLGDPVSHSLSPQFQNAAIDALGLDGEYRAIRCSREEVPGLIREIAAGGGAGNVTVPHKEIAAESIDVPTEAVRATGACNSFWLEGGKVHGDNTDVPGFRAAAEALLGKGIRGARVLLIGAGGAARGAAFALVEGGAREVVVLNRSAERARDLAARFDSSGTSFKVADSPDSVRDETFDLVVNATSLGLREGDPFPLAPDAGLSVSAALDLVYRPDETAWVKAMRAAGTPAADGLEMLLQQGAAAFERWWGVPAPVGVMRAALPRRSTPLPPV